MKTTKFLTILFLAFATLFFNSCEDDNVTIPVDTHEDAYGDILLKKVKTSGAPKYMIVAFAGGSTISTTECKLIYPNTTSYTIPELSWSPGTLQYMTPQNEMFTDPTTAYGNYTFKLKFADGYEKTITETIDNTDVGLHDFTYTYDPASTPNKITVNWTDVDITNGSLICIKIIDNTGNNKPYYKIAKLPTFTATGSHTINFDGGTGWMRPVSELTAGTTYKISMAVKKVEDGKPVDGASKDMEFVSCVMKTFVR